MCKFVKVSKMLEELKNDMVLDYNIQDGAMEIGTQKFYVFIEKATSGIIVKVRYQESNTYHINLIVKNQNELCDLLSGYMVEEQSQNIEVVPCDEEKEENMDELQLLKITLNLIEEMHQERITNGLTKKWHELRTLKEELNKKARLMIDSKYKDVFKNDTPSDEIKEEKARLENIPSDKTHALYNDVRVKDDLAVIFATIDDLQGEKVAIYDMNEKAELIKIDSIDLKTFKEIYSFLGYANIADYTPKNEMEKEDEDFITIMSIEGFLVNAVIVHHDNKNLKSRYNHDLIQTTDGKYWEIWTTFTGGFAAVDTDEYNQVDNEMTFDFDDYDEERSKLLNPTNDMEKENEEVAPSEEQPQPKNISHGEYVKLSKPFSNYIQNIMIFDKQQYKKDIVGKYELLKNLMIAIFESESAILPNTYEGKKDYFQRYSKNIKEDYQKFMINNDSNDKNNLKKAYNYNVELIACDGLVNELMGYNRGF